MSSDLRGIQEIIKDSKIVYPDKARQAATEMGSREAFQTLLEKSQEDPETFWNEVAQELHWFKPWEKTISGSLPDFEFFKGGISNPCYNLLDRHIKNGAGNRTALIWERSEEHTSELQSRGHLVCRLL